MLTPFALYVLGSLPSARTKKLTSFPRAARASDSLRIRGSEEKQEYAIMQTFLFISLKYVSGYGLQVTGEDTPCYGLQVTSYKINRFQVTGYGLVEFMELLG